MADPFWRCTHMFDQPVRLQRQQPAKYTPAGAAEYVWAGEVFVQARSSDLDLVRRQQERIMVSASCWGRHLVRRVCVQHKLLAGQLDCCLGCRDVNGGEGGQGGGGGAWCVSPAGCVWLS